ncbi:3-dehydroquinate synthase [Blautia pseudococcoides]|uniref:3-dehydroquinate synthase n=1 Tax=Blautia pseudococcoides TaxID=1796616 RepID=UPI00148B060B|nr:3-dehydroquinate synthase [Blautia pseudococcoides]QJU15971.1 3-dehydroquinate synthase [Blautia pseudococcoides]
MEKIEIKLNDINQTVIIDDNFLNITSAFDFYSNETKVIIITDTAVGELYLESLIKAINISRQKIYPLIIKPGEKSKNFSTVNKLYKALLKIGANREDLVIALGGGVIGDISGFVAATYHRGLKLIQIPTTLLAQIDSSIGGKNAINFEDNKNIIGTIHQPALIYINVSVLNSLDIQNKKNAMVEAIIHAIIRDQELLNFIDLNYKKILLGEKNFLMPFIYKNCTIKLQVIMQDQYDSTIRKSLNLGHTIGHAIESAYNYEFSHGESVSMGLIAALKLSVMLQNFPKQKYYFIKSLLNKIGLPTIIETLEWDKIINKIQYDKKKVREDPLFVLVKDTQEILYQELKIDSDVIEIFRKKI